MKIVIDRLIHKERKFKDCGVRNESVSGSVLAAKQKWNQEALSAMDVKDMDITRETALRICTTQLYPGILSIDSQLKGEECCSLNTR